MRIKISITILAAMVIFSSLSGWFIHNRCGRIVENLTEIENLIAEGDYENAEKSAKSLEKYWNRFSNAAVMFVRSDKLTEAESNFSRIIPLIQTENDELSAELSELKDRIQHISDSEKILLRNIL